MCCASGRLDECGVCDGDSSTCALAIAAQIAGNNTGLVLQLGQQAAPGLSSGVQILSPWDQHSEPCGHMAPVVHAVPATAFLNALMAACAYHQWLCFAGVAALLGIPNAAVNASMIAIDSNQQGSASASIAVASLATGLLLGRRLLHTRVLSQAAEQAAMLAVSVSPRTISNKTSLVSILTSGEAVQLLQVGAAICGCTCQWL